MSVSIETSAFINCIK